MSDTTEVKKPISGKLAALGCLSAVFGIPYLVIAWGYILHTFWYWFVLPVFPMLPAITIAQAIGLKAVFAILNNISAKVDKKLADVDGNTKIDFSWMLIPPVTLGWGWILHYFIS